MASFYLTSNDILELIKKKLALSYVHFFKHEKDPKCQNLMKNNTSIKIFLQFKSNITIRKNYMQVLQSSERSYLYFENDHVVIDILYQTIHNYFNPSKSKKYDTTIFQDPWGLRF